MASSPAAGGDDIKLKLSDAIRDVQYLLSSGADKNQLLTGTSSAGGGQGRMGLNHVNELWQMLPDAGNTGEFRVRE